MPFFTVTHKDKNSYARTGVISTMHGDIETPAFVPVGTRAAMKGLTGEQMHQMNAQVLMVNMYHTYLRPGVDLVKKFKGLHGFMKWDKPLMTDSGGFQVFSLAQKEGLVKVSDDSVAFRSHIDASKHVFTPENSIINQIGLGADLIMAFDECVSYPAERKYVEQSVERTHEWLKICIDTFRSHYSKRKKKQYLYGIVQGGPYEDLRKKSAAFVAGQDIDGIAIGGVSVGEPKKVMRNMVEWVRPLLPDDKPIHLLGLGNVDDIFMGVENGADTFDCVLPTRLAREGYIFSFASGNGKKWRYRVSGKKYREDKKPLDEDCSCHVCKTYSRAYIHHLFRVDELLGHTLASYHNVAFFVNLMKEIREGISKGEFERVRRKWMG